VLKKVLAIHKHLCFNLLVNIGKHIKKIRKSLGLTQEQFAIKISKTRGAVAKYETNKAVPPGDVLLRIQALVENGDK